MSKFVNEYTPTLAIRKKDCYTTALGKLVCWWCKTDYYHVELILKNKWISARIKDGVTIRQLKPLKDKYLYVKLPPKTISIEVYESIVSYGLSLNHTKYDTWGLLLNQMLGINFYNRKKFCSELVVELLQYAGYEELFGKSPSEYSPDDLYRIFYLKENHVTLRKFTLFNKIKRLLKWIKVLK